MANLNVQRKPPSFWPWAVGIAAIVLVLLLILWLMRSQEEDRLPHEAPGETVGAVTPGAVPERGAAPGGAAVEDPMAAYRAATNNLTPDLATNPERLASLIDHLAAAVSEVGGAAPERAAALQARADSTRMGDWRLPRQAYLVRSAFDDATAVLLVAAEQGDARVQPQAVEEVRIAATRVTPELPLAAQGEEIVAFLQRVSRALEGVR
jgi:hypothetical protein